VGEECGEGVGGARHGGLLGACCPPGGEPSPRFHRGCG
jgi:hypothetical protein